VRGNAYLFHGQTSVFGVMDVLWELLRDNPLPSQPARPGCAGR